LKASWLRLAALALFSIALAGSCLAQTQKPIVPEIGAGSGGTALTLLGGVMLWAQQARRRG